MIVKQNPHRQRMHTRTDYLLPPTLCYRCEAADGTEFDFRYGEGHSRFPSARFGDVFDSAYEMMEKMTGAICRLDRTAGRDHRIIDGVLVQAFRICSGGELVGTVWFPHCVPRALTHDDTLVVREPDLDDHVHDRVNYDARDMAIDMMIRFERRGRDNMHAMPAFSRREMVTARYSKLLEYRAPPWLSQHDKIWHIDGRPA